MQVYKTQTHFDHNCEGKTLSFPDFNIRIQRAKAKGAVKICWNSQYTTSEGTADKAILIEVSCNTKKETERVVKEFAIQRILEGHPAILNVDRSFIVRSDKYQFWFQVQPLYNTDLYYAIINKTFYDDPGQILSVIDQLAKGMVYIHGKGVVLGDVKPENILYDHGKIKYIDWGGADTEINRKCTQTYNYRAPEGFVDDLNSFQTNIWSLGLIFASLRSDGGSLKTPYMYVENSFTLPSYISAIRDFTNKIERLFWSSIVISMLQVNPNNRLSAESVVARLRPYSVAVRSKREVEDAAG
jgi:serine/threonine protein kinase